MKDFGPVELLISVIVVFTLFCFCLTQIEIAAKNNIGEYFCNNHNGLATINPHNYREFTCEDGSSWQIEVTNTHSEYKAPHRHNSNSSH